MATNLTDITDAIANLNATLEINTSDILTNAISSSNDSTNGWLGIIIFALMSLSVLISIVVKKQSFGIFERTTLFMIFLCIVLDIGIYLFKFNILQSIYVLIWLFTAYYTVVIFSLMKKELTSTEN